jgi:uncharacterized iron-regulated membrane protein
MTAAKTDVLVPSGRWAAWLRQPQHFWPRKAIFQVHLWTGVILSAYVLLMSVSGTILIYRVEISRASLRPRVISSSAGKRLTQDQLKSVVHGDYPGYRIAGIAAPKSPNQAVEISLERGGEEMRRLFDPYTGEDVGNALPAGFRFIEWLTDLHDNFLYAPAGRIINGIGGMATIMLGVSGAVIWWPGAGKWRRALTFQWKTDARTVHWGLHRSLGIWSLAFVMLWAVSGVYLAVPEPFETAVAFLYPPVPGSRKAAVAEQALSWLARLHFGRFGGMTSKLVWTLFGLVPVALVITGVWMWWSRVVRSRLRGISV